MHGFSQKVIHKSNLEFYPNQLSNFHSSITIDESTLYFSANDYYLYAIDKNSFETKWSTYIGWKTDKKIIELNESILFPHEGLLIHKTEGIIKDTLQIHEINYEPFLKNNTLYLTTIESDIGGVLMSYDLKNNHKNWSIFIAHGIDKQPIYNSTSIIANAEGDNWFEINYEGKLLNQDCSNPKELFVPDITCVKNYEFLTHDGKEINQNFIEKNLSHYYGHKIFENNTVVFSTSEVLIIEKNKKILHSINLASLLKEDTEYNSEKMEIFSCDDTSISFLYNNYFMVYDTKSNQLKKKINMNLWQPHQIALDNNQKTLYLIAGNDGQLYKIALE